MPAIEERVQICISRLQKAGLLDYSIGSDTMSQFKAVFDNKSNPEAITKNLLYMHSKGFNFNDATVKRQLFADSARVIGILEDRELFFKEGFEAKASSMTRMNKCPALKEFLEKNINKDQSSNMYFGLQILESNGCFSAPTETVSAQLKEKAVNLLGELEESYSSKYRVKEAGGSPREQSIDLLPERVVKNFIALKEEDYNGVFAKRSGGAMFGGVNNGLTEDMIKVLANPFDKGSFDSIVPAFSGLVPTTTRSIELGHFIDCWKKVLELDENKKFYDLVAKDNNDQLVAFLRRSDTVDLTPDILRTAYARLPKAPSSEFNQKLLLLQQGVLEKVESVSMQASDFKINWTEILRDVPLKNFSENIMQRTRLIAISTLPPEEARKALGEVLKDESQREATLHALQENKVKISGGLSYLSELLNNTVSAEQRNLLIDCFSVDVNVSRSSNFQSDLKSVLGLLQWVRTNGSIINENNRKKLEAYIDNTMEPYIGHIGSITTGSYTQFPSNRNQILQAWKNAQKKTLVVNEDETAYCAVQNLRRKNPVNLKEVSQILSDHMAKNPGTAFSVELKNIFGDFFTQYTPSRVATVQVSTPPAADPPNYKA